MNLNKNFLTEVIKYLISKGVTVHDVLDAFHAQFEYHEQNISRQDELRKPLTDIDLLLCGRSVEESSTPCTAIDSNRGLCQKVFDTSKENPLPCRKLKSKSGQMLFDVINGKTVIEHLKENGITYSNFDNRIRKKWSVADACTTPLAPRGKGKRKRVIEQPGEPEEPMAVIVPDNVKVVEESSTLEKPEKTLETKTETLETQTETLETQTETLETQTETLETQSNTEKATESVTNATALNGNNVTAVILDTPNHDAIHGDKDDYIEKALKKFITSTTGIEFEESKKDKKPKESKKDYTVADVCFKLNVTTHELKGMINTGEFPQPDCGNKWSVKLLKDKNLI